MSDWDLKKLFSERNDSIALKLAGLRCSIGHGTMKGNETERTWQNLFASHLPERYRVTSGVVADSENNFSDQIDILIFDRHYSPFIFVGEDVAIIPAESVYAVFEVKQDAKPKHIRDARKRIASVRKLHRTSQPVKHTGGVFEAKEPPLILGGILTLDVGAKDAESSLRNSLAKHSDGDRIDLGCIANHGYFSYNGNQIKNVGDEQKDYDIHKIEKPVMKFLFELILKLQNMRTVPVIDTKAYAKFIDG